MSDGDMRERCRECSCKLGTDAERQWGTCDACCRRFRAQFEEDKRHDQMLRRLERIA